MAQNRRNRSSINGGLSMPDFIVLGSDHKWFACYKWSDALNIAKEMFKSGCEYVKIIKNNEITHWTTNDIKI